MEAEEISAVSQMRLARKMQFLPLLFARARAVISAVTRIKMKKVRASIIRIYAAQMQRET